MGGRAGFTDVAYLLDWRTDEPLKRIPTESSNTSGMAYVRDEGNGAKVRRRFTTGRPAERDAQKDEGI